MDRPEVNIPEFIFLKFADSKIPVFKETPSKDYILYGEKNNYPEYLTYQFDKSAKHNAIINGKAGYIFGNGYVNGDIIVNELGETLNMISRRAILDVELYGGFKLEVIFNMFGKIAQIFHVDYTTMRKGKENGFFYKEAWVIRDAFGNWVNNTKVEETYVPQFDPNDPKGSQIYEYNEYRPMTRFYPLPSYLGCLNYIETDIEISKFHLSSIRNGMMPSKMIQFYEGEPSEDKKREIEGRLAKKFAGSENAGKFILIFNKTKDKTVDVSDLSSTEMDKLFDKLNQTCQQEIFSGHGITSPMLFGIKTEGQLGGNTELYTAYSIFQNTYAKPKADAFDREMNYLLSHSIFANQYELQPSDPIGVQIDIHDVVNSLPKSFVFETLGIPKDTWDEENIGADNRPTPTTPIAPGPPPPDATTQMVNENLKHLTAKQLQNINRVIRQYKKGQMAQPMAKALLQNGYGLSDADIDKFLGIQPAKMSADDDDDIIIGMFDACGDNKDDFEVLKSKRVSFSSELEMEGDEEVYIKEAFKTLDVTFTENQILELIKKDKRITPEIIAKVLNQTIAFVVAKIDSLTKRGYLESTTETIGADEIIERTVPKAIDIIAPPPAKNQTPATQIFIKYSYEGPRDNKNRPFCAKMLELHRLYSRAEIEQISQRLGYSVFDRRGGFWTRKGTNYTTPWCRHNWKSNIVIKKQ